MQRLPDGQTRTSGLDKIYVRYEFVNVTTKPVTSISPDERADRESSRTAA